MPITSSGRAPDGDILDAVKAHIEEERPIGATVLVYALEEILIATKAVISITKDTTAEDVKRAYAEKLENYLKGSVFLLQAVDYYKCLSLFYEIGGVAKVSSFLLNGAEESIAIGEKQIQVMGDIEIEVG